MKKTKDVLLMCQFFYPEYVSSATLPFDTAKALADAGYKVGALCGYPKEYSEGEKVPKRENVEGVDIKRLKYIQVGRKGTFGKLINYFSFVIAVFFNLFTAARYKMILVYSNPPILPFFALMAKKLFGCKLVFVSYDVYPEIASAGGYTGGGGIITKALIFTNKHVFKNADRVVAVSADMMDYLRSNRNISKEKVMDIPNWYADGGECLKGDRKNTRLFSEYSNEDFIVSYLGNLGICQDDTTIIDAMRELRHRDNIKFIFAGHGSKMESLKNTVQREGLSNVKIHGFLRGQDFEDVLAVSDMYIVSLIDGLYGLCAPSKAYSYMMQGRAIITIMDKKSEIALDVSENNAGGCFANNEGKEIAAFIEEMSKDPEKCLEMGRNSRKVFLEKYEKKKCLAKYIDLTKEMIGE